MEENELEVSQIDTLVKATDRLYCAWQALLYGATSDHEAKIGAELAEINNILDEIIEDHEAMRHWKKEEMRKFTEGFAYVPKEKRNSAS